MKTPKAQQLPSGSWRCRIRVDGKDVSITAETEKLAIAQAMAVKAGIIEETKTRSDTMTLREAIDTYISWSAAASPASLRGYQIIRDNRLQAIMDIPLKRVTDDRFQKEFTAASRIYAPKTVKTTYTFVKTVLRNVCKRDIDLIIAEPVDDPHVFLDPDQIPVFLKAVRGHQHELPILLMLHSLRVSEVLDLTWQDIDLQRGLITVHGAAVPGIDNKTVHKKANKNKTSRRLVPIMIPRVRELVEAQEDRSGYITKLSSPGLCAAVNRVCRSAGLPEVGNHGLRHSYASLAYSIRMPEKIAAQVGGWKDSGTMHKIYTHIAERDIALYTGQMAAYYANVEDQISRSELSDPSQNVHENDHAATSPQ